MVLEALSSHLGKALLPDKSATGSTQSLQGDVQLKRGLVHVFFQCLKENRPLEQLSLKPQLVADCKIFSVLLLIPSPLLKSMCRHKSLHSNQGTWFKV